MRWLLLGIGPPKDKLASALADQYVRRLKPYGRYEETWLPKGRGSTPEELRHAESEALRKALPDGFRRVVLDERGELLTSPQLAASLEAQALQGQPRFAFLIGGAHGHDPQLREDAHQVLALSRLTLPHALARVLLIEQLYRAMTLLRGEPYHKT